MGYRDRRSLGSTPKPSGVLIGHTEGITYVSAKGDGRYVISNGKDQVLRLWDLRKMRSNLEFEQVKDKHFGIPNFDYRWVDKVSHSPRGMVLIFNIVAHRILSQDIKPTRRTAALCSTRGMKFSGL